MTIRIEIKIGEGYSLNPIVMQHVMLRPKHIFEYAALRLVAVPLQILPYPAALAFGWIIARLTHNVARIRVAEAKRRIRLALGNEIPEAQARAIAWRSWRNIVFSAVEMIRVSRADRAWFNAYWDCRLVMEALSAHAASGRGGVIAVPHMGSWEMAGLACHRHGIPIFTLAATQKNPLVDAYINQLRRAPGIETVARGDGGMRAVIRKLRSGGMLAILPDVRMRTPDLSLPFLGGTANLGQGMALFARLADVPIFPCVVTRHGWMRHRITLDPPIHPDKTLDKAEDIRRMTRLVVNGIDKAIRREPEQWFWFNKRWVLDAVGEQVSSEEREP